MHVLVIPSWYPANSADFMGSFFQEQTQALAHNKIKVGVLVPTVNTPYTSHHFSHFRCSWTREKGIPVGRCKINQWIPRGRRLTAELSARHLLDALHSYESVHGTPDVLHAQSLYPAGFFADTLSRLTGIPWILTEHRSLNHMIQRTMIGRISESSTVRRAQARIAVSRGHAVHLNERIGRYGGEWKYVPNLLSRASEQGAIVSRSPGDPFTVCHVSGFDPIKRVDLVVQGFIRAFSHDSRARLRIAGPRDTKIAGKIRAQIASSGCAERIEMSGVLTRQKVADFFAESDVMVFPSTQETFGIALIEALAAGIPVITTPTWGGTTIVENARDNWNASTGGTHNSCRRTCDATTGDNAGIQQLTLKNANSEPSVDKIPDGIIVPRNNVEAIAHALRDIQSWDRSAEARRARKQRCVEKFGEAAFIERYRNIYQEATRDY